jgi:hypothetical protein
MRLRAVLLILVLTALGAAVLLALPKPTAPQAEAVITPTTAVAEATAPSGEIALKLSSDPFPMTVGPNALRVSLTDEHGAAIEGADVSVTWQMMHHEGAIPNKGVLTQTASGDYSGRVVWPMAAPWRVEINAALPDGTTLADQYEIYVYAIPPQTISGEPYYHGLTATNEAVAADPERELWIVIPQGTQEMIKHGLAADVVPEEIRLEASGRNTLIIRNNDISDHTIGPYFIRAGETVRQRFTQPATFVGTCSIRQQAEVSIIVEG